MSAGASNADESNPGRQLRARIVEAAAELIEQGGRDAATTRAVAAAAGVQPPTLYRLFGDKRGLLDAAAQHSIASYVARKAARGGVASSGLCRDGPHAAESAGAGARSPAFHSCP